MQLEEVANDLSSEKTRNIVYREKRSHGATLMTAHMSFKALYVLIVFPYLRTKIATERLERDQKRINLT